MLPQLLVDPAPSGQKYLNLSSYCFLIESQHCNQKVVYDLAFMRDLDTRMPPALKALFAGDVEAMAIDEFHHIPNSPMDHGVDLAEVNAVIWSHAHLDHVGNPSVFPPSTELVVVQASKHVACPVIPVYSLAGSGNAGGYRQSKATLERLKAFDGRDDVLNHHHCT
jgi:hypothetical protein